jgi:hypothetical protein
MVNTYYNHFLNALRAAEQEDYSSIRKQAYEKWRGASNYITYTLIEETLRDRKPMIHGATSTGEHIEALFKKLKDLGYDITLLLCSCEDSVRSQAVTYRNTVQRFYQSTPEDAVTKGKNFPIRMPVYFSQADTLYIMWSDSLFQPERLAAVLQDGKIKVVDQQALKLFAKKFEKDRDVLNKQGIEIPSWDDLLAIYKSRHPSASS